MAGLRRIVFAIEVHVVSVTSHVAEEMEQHRAAVTRYIHYLVRNTAEAEKKSKER
jgi:hypothetical protein